MAQGNPIPESLCQFSLPRFCYDTRREAWARRFYGRYRLPRRSTQRNAQYSSSGRKIPGLPNNRASEMIRGCEIRSIPGRRPPPRSLHDDPVEYRLVVHGFSRRRREGARRPCRAL